MDKIAEKFQALGTGEKIVLIAGAVLFVAGFLPWYSISLEPFGTFTRNGWQSPGAIWSILPILIGLALAGVTALRNFTDVDLPDTIGGQSWAKAYLAGGGAALLFVVIKFLNENEFLGYGFYLGFLAAAALAGAGYLMYKEDAAAPRSIAGSLPEERKKSA